jgi:predicted RNA methylase
MSDLMEIVDDAREFFAPVSSDVIDGLLGQYQQKRGHIDTVAGIVAGEVGGVISYFIEGNKDRASHMPSPERLFEPAGAIAALNSTYWSKAMSLTDVYDCMPQARRDEWSKSIRDHATPEFTEEAVRPTISGLLADRAKFFAERVDGIFRGLSGEHVTNCPQGFSKRMIIANVTANNFHSTSKVGIINDLRAVIAKFMGRDEPNWNSTGPVIKIADRQSGKWLTVDGGTLRIRTYKIGTAHLEVHPDMAYRLNQVLAGMYPRAIPAEFRTKPAKKHKEFQMIGRPLPFAVLTLLGDLKQAQSYRRNDRDRVIWTPIPNAVAFAHGARESAAFQEAQRVLMSIGGVLTKAGDWQFDYSPSAAIDEIVASGCVPDVKAHQYYPTPDVIARAAIELAHIGPDDTVLEPSAGQGGIADYFPLQHHAVCVEVSKLHCDILRAKGFVTVHADFMEWAATAPKFDRVIMNPPFSEGRALAHLQAAAALLKPAGRIVAVLPASFKDKDVLPGFDVRWSDVYSGEFAGTGVSVVICKAERFDA